MTPIQKAIDDHMNGTATVIAIKDEKQYHALLQIIEDQTDVMWMCGQNPTHADCRDYFQMQTRQNPDEPVCVGLSTRDDNGMYYGKVKTYADQGHKVIQASTLITNKRR